MAKSFPIKAVISAVDRFTKPMRGISRGLKGNLGRSLGDVGRSAGAVGGQLRGLLGPVAILGGAASIAGVVSLVKTFASGADEIGKFSRQVGLTAEAYQELAFAADRQGVPQAKFNAALATLDKRVGKARAGFGPLFTALKKASPALLAQVQAANGTEEAFNLITKAMETLENENDKTLLADAAFGVLSMTRVAEAGAEGIAKLREEKRRYGVVSTEATQQAEIFQDKITNLTSAFSGIQDVIGSRVLPVLIPLLEKFKDFLVVNREIIGTKISEFIGRFAKRLAQVDFNAVFASIEKFFGAIGKAVDFVGGFENAFIVLIALMNGPLIVAVGSLLLSLGKLAFLLKGPLLTAIPVVATALKALGVAAIANPLGAVLVILAGAAALIIAKWDVIGPFFADLWEGVKNAFQSALTFIEPIVSKVTGFVNSISNGIGSVGKFLGFNQGPSLAGATPQGGTALPSALPPQGRSTSQANVTVSFENAPKGLRVTENRSTSPQTNVETNVGFSSMLAGVDG